MVTKIHDLDSYRLPAEVGSVVRMPPRPPDGLVRIIALLRHRPEYIPYVAALLDVCEAGKRSMFRDIALLNVAMAANIVDDPAGHLTVSNEDYLEYLARRKAQLRPRR